MQASKKQKEFWIKNLLVAQAMMQDIDVSAFDLGQWASDEMLRHGPHTCGSAACFGGYVAITPYFQNLGVEPSFDGVPVMPEQGAFSGDEAALLLFGDEDMFRCNSSYPPVPDKDLVMRRIENQLKVLTA